MSEPDDFLSRWSRRKSAAAKAPEQAPISDDADAASADAAPKLPGPGPVSAAPETVFDPASLPSIDSIGADTDIAAFLKPGVPSDLRHAALRRAWSMDPAIRDFKGLQENDWNFNDPDGIPGFGALSPQTDVKKMLGQMFGEPEPVAPGQDAPREMPAIAGEPQVAADDGNDVGRSEFPALHVQGATAGPSGDAVHVQSNIDGAMQHKESAAGEEAQTNRRTHGGALPR